jgi:uncharacterized membrane protein YkoI
MFTKKNLTIGLTLAALVAVMISGATLYAQQGTTTPQAATQTNHEENVQDPGYGGSISVPENMSDQSLAGLAKITASDAENAALAQFPGATVIKTELDNENGALVYSVELQTSGGIKDVRIDAGNARILYTDSGVDLDEGHTASEGGEASAGEPETTDSAKSD